MALNWLGVYVLEQTFNRVEILKAKNQSNFDVRNNSQLFNAATLSKVYADRMIFNTFFQKVSILESSAEKSALTRLLSFFGTNLIIKYLELFYEGGFLCNKNSGLFYKSGIIEMIPKIKDDAIGLIDAIAPPDFIMNTPLGMSDGEIYKNLESSIINAPGVFERPEWWKEAVYTKSKM